jgi:hypothetical protein
MNIYHLRSIGTFGKICVPVFSWLIPLFNRPAYITLIIIGKEYIPGNKYF